MQYAVPALFSETLTVFPLDNVTVSVANATVPVALTTVLYAEKSLK